MLKGKIAKWLYKRDHSYDSWLTASLVLREYYGKEANRIFNLFKAEYPIMYKEEADEVGDFIRRGWIPPEHFKMMLDKLTVIDDGEIITDICGSCRWEDKFTDEDCHACQRNIKVGISIQLQHTKKQLLDLMGE